MSSGRSVILRAGGQVVGFLTEKKTKITAAPKKITNGDSDGFRTYSPAPAKLTAQIQLKGNAKTEWMRNAGLSPGVQVTLFNIELSFTGGSKITGSFYVAEFTEGGESGTARELTLTLESTGQWELTTGTTPPVEQIVAITFGQYPWLAGVDSFGITPVIKSLTMREIPQPDVEPFAITPSIKSLSMPVVAVYNTVNAGPDSFAMAPSVKSLTLNITANYVESSTGPDGFTLTPTIKSLTMSVVANYAMHTLYDADQFGITASIKSLTLSSV